MSQGSTILVPVDFSTYSCAAVERACVLAAARSAEIRLLHALHLPPFAHEIGFSDPAWSELRAAEAARLEELGRSLESRGIPVSTCFEEADPVDAIRVAARASDVDLIVMGSHGRRGLDRLMLGSVAERTLQRASVPVLIVREAETETAHKMGPILFATDFSEYAEDAARVVSNWAQELRCEVEVFHAIRDPIVLFAPYAVPDVSGFEAEMWEAAGRRIEVVLDRFRAVRVSAKPKIVSGYASDEIIKRADQIGSQLVAMGTRGYTGLRRYRMGSVVERVLRHASCNVLVAGAPTMHPMHLNLESKELQA